jgi:ribosomal protein S18 acetylase RimI-like enzyme
MAPFFVREFHYLQDYPAVVRLWEEMEKGIHLGPSDRPAEIQKKLQRDPELFLVAETGGEIIGAVMGGFDGRRGMVYHLAVAASFRRRGIASGLMSELESRLRAKGCLKCYLLVTVDNEEAMGYYERHGWSAMEQVRLYGKEFS